MHRECRPNCCRDSMNSGRRHQHRAVVPATAREPHGHEGLTEGLARRRPGLRARDAAADARQVATPRGAWARPVNCGADAMAHAHQVAAPVRIFAVARQFSVPERPQTPRPTGTARRPVLRGIPPRTSCGCSFVGCRSWSWGVPRGLPSCVARIPARLQATRWPETDVPDVPALARRCHGRCRRSDLSAVLVRYVSRSDAVCQVIAGFCHMPEVSWKHIFFGQDRS
jgi:hypothetical protein